jgi:antitoxin VapB
MDKAKVFWSGRSQAVRLPKEFRFEGKEVRIRRHGTGVLLEPIAADWDWLDRITRPLDADFIAAVMEQPPAQERPEIDEFFRNR